MPAKTTPKPKGKTPAKGKGILKKKVGPIPVIVLVGVGAVLVFLLYRRTRNASSPTGVDGTSTVTPTANLTPQDAATAGSPSTGGSSFDPSQLADILNSEAPTDYATKTDLQSGLDSLGSNTASQIAAITFPNPNIVINNPAPAKVPVPSVKPVAAKQATSTVKKVASTPTHYFTLKKNVVLSHGQTLHFKAGKGYYAA